MKGPMAVKISLDGGSSFDEIYYFDKNDELPGQAIIDLGKSDSKTAVIRLEGYLERGAPESIISISDLSIDNLENDPDNIVTVYPSVTNGIINIKFNTDSEKVTLYIFNLKGNVLMSRNLSTEEYIQLDLSGFAAGVYYIRTDLQGRSVTKTIIKN
jgi:hypothetical protein